METRISREMMVLPEKILATLGWRFSTNIKREAVAMVSRIFKATERPEGIWKEEKGQMKMIH